MEEKTFVGYGYGRFQDDAGNMRSSCNVFVLEPFNGEESSDDHFGGQQAVKYGCVSPDVWKDVQPGMKVKCFFDSRKKVSYMVAAGK